MGYAVGVIGMSVDDFCACTPSEFEAVCAARHKAREAEDHAHWERMRWLACLTLQPHTKKRLRPKDLMRFPWEQATTTTAPTISKAERIERIRKRLGKLL